MWAILRVGFWWHAWWCARMAGFKAVYLVSFRTLNASGCATQLGLVRSSLDPRVSGRDSFCCANCHEAQASHACVTGVPAETSTRPQQLSHPSQERSAKIVDFACLRGNLSMVHASFSPAWKLSCSAAGVGGQGSRRGPPPRSHPPAVVQASQTAQIPLDSPVQFMKSTATTGRPLLAHLPLTQIREPCCADPPPLLPVPTPGPSSSAGIPQAARTGVAPQSFRLSRLRRGPRPVKRLV